MITNNADNYDFGSWYDANVVVVDIDVEDYHLDCPLEESLAGFAGENPIMETGDLVTADLQDIWSMEVVIMCVT